MKKFILFVFSVLMLHTFSYADQLAYLTKSDADKAASYIQKAKNVAFFCGCCDHQEKEIVKVKGVEVKFTGYEQYYEVFVMYSYQGELKSVPVDLAYVWVKVKGQVMTVGKVLGLEHDPCKTIDW